MFDLFGITRTPAIKGAGAVALMEEVTLGGVPQWVAIRGRSKENPMLVFFHGGPGSSDLGTLRRILPRLEEHFLVVNWCQPGSEKFDGELPEGSLTVSRLLSDARELVAMMLNRYGQQKAYIAGHSVGTALGLLFAQRHPELVRAYVGINQVVDRAEEERRSYDAALEAARQAGIRKAVAQLEAIGRPETGLYRSETDMVTQRQWLTKLGGVSLKPADATQWHMTNYLVAEYRWRDRLRIFKALGRSTRALWAEYNDLHLAEQVRELQVPVTFVMGRHDRITYVDLVEKFARELKAPSKEVIVFEQSGHLSFVEEPERFCDLMIDRVLRDAPRAAAG